VRVFKWRNSSKILLILLLVTGCKLSSQQTSQDLGVCADEPKPSLIDRTAPKLTVPSGESITQTGKLKANQGVTYQIDVQAGQTLNFKVKPLSKLCIWKLQPNFSPLKTKEISQNGTYFLHIETLKEDINFEAIIALDSEGGVISPPKPPKPPKPPEPPVPFENKLSQREAVEIVKGWYNAKPDIFGPNYQTSAVPQYATGQLYYETVEKCNNGICGGSVGWLKQNGCYYIYDFSKIQQVVSFYSSDSEAELVINLKERLQSHGSKTAGCGKVSDYQKNVTYWLKKEGKVWKIYKYKVGN